MVALIQLHEDLTSALLIIVLLEVSFAFGYMMIICDLCQRITDAFEELSETIYQLDWYSFPNEVQQILPIVINFTQQPIEFNCFGSTPLTRELFKLVRISSGD